jgi:four helix bundle protein
MRRAVTSVPANIAEGSARKGSKEQDQFFFIARGSLSELETHLLVASRLSFLTESTYGAVKARCDRVAALLEGLIRRREGRT